MMAATWLRHRPGAESRKSFCWGGRAGFPSADSTLAHLGQPLWAPHGLVMPASPLMSDVP